MIPDNFGTLEMKEEQQKWQITNYFCLSVFSQLGLIMKAKIIPTPDEVSPVRSGAT